MTDADRARLAAIKNLADAATPAPWIVETIGEDAPPFDHQYISGHITAAAHNSAGNSASRRDSVCAPDSMTALDAEFVAAARTELPWLVELVEQQGDGPVLAVIRAALEAKGESNYINNLEVALDRVRRALDGRDWRNNDHPIVEQQAADDRAARVRELVEFYKYRSRKGSWAGATLEEDARAYVAALEAEK